MTELEALEWCKQHEARIEFHKEPIGSKPGSSLCKIEIVDMPVIYQETFLQAVQALKFWVDQLENPQPLKVKE